jgi:hypothetical protein
MARRALGYPARRARTTGVAVLGALLGALALACSVNARDAHSGNRTVSTPVANATLEVTIAPGPLALDDTTLARLLGDSLRGIATYYGRLPFDRARVAVTPRSKSGIHGSTWCSDGGLVRLELGPEVNAAAIRRDWVITHELLHVAFTSLEDEDAHGWVGEGLASYVEPLVRVRAGTLSEGELWREFYEGAPQGLPEAGDQGLDRTHTWGRTYWGGALFWFEVDLLVREETGNAKSVRDALRAIAAAGTNVCVDLPVERMLAVGDSGTGTRVLSRVYQRRALTNASPELAEWWKKLGIRGRDRQAVFDDSAPWAETRRRMTRD